MRPVSLLDSVGSLALVGLLGLMGCTLNADAPAPYKPDPLGNGLRLSQIQDPASSEHRPCPSTSKSCPALQVSSVVVVTLDQWDETHDGKSAGTLYLEDVGTPHAYGGIGVYEPNYIPASLSPLPGDVFDSAGPYQEDTSIGSAMFNAGTYLPQLFKPVETLRYEYTTPAPLVIQATDLYEELPSKPADSNFPQGRKYLQMLVTIEDVTIGASGVDSSGYRITYPILGPNGSTITAGPAISNELFDLSGTQYTSGTHFKSVTGIVTWFYSYHIAPRSLDDLVQ